jgi:hypothetical protein
MSTSNTILLTISAAKSCEVAGFYFKNAACTSASASMIYVTGNTTTPAQNIHHNNFAVVLGGTTDSPILKNDLNAFTYSDFHHNFIYINVDSSGTMTKLINIGADATGAKFRNNHIKLQGAGQTFTNVVGWAAVWGLVADNYIYTQGATDPTVSTSAFLIGTQTTAIRNYIAGATTKSVSGGTSDYSYISNYCSLAGGTLITTS